MCDSECVEFLKHKSGKPLKSGEKRIVLNVFNSLRKKNPTCAVKQLEVMTSELTGISTKSIQNLRTEFRETGKVVTPGKKRKRNKPVIDHCDEFVKTAIKLQVHDFFRNNEPPTVTKILRVVNDDPYLPNFKRATFYKIFKSIGFKFLKRNLKNCVTERDDIINWRRDYLIKIKKYREEGRKIFYLDETWVNEGQTSSKIWCDTKIMSAKQAFLDGLSIGLKSPSSKGRRLIVGHVGSEDGFLENALLVFESKKSGDYHQDMNGDVFINWFKNVIQLLPEKSVIVMDNAPYHSVFSERLPNMSWRKDQIVSWLNEKTIVHDPNKIKLELIKIVKQHESIYKKYIVDELAKLHEQIVLRLPPYHCVLNPIEMAWNQVKGFVARNNKTFKLNDVRTLLEKGVANVSSVNWKNYIKHVQKEEQLFWNLDHIVDVVVDSMIINPNEDSDSDSLEDTDLEGIDEMTDADD